MCSLTQVLTSHSVMFFFCEDGAAKFVVVVPDRAQAFLMLQNAVLNIRVI